LYLFKKSNFTYDQIRKVNFRQNSEESFSIEIDLFNGKFFCLTNQNVFLKNGIYKLLEEKKARDEQIRKEKAEKLEQESAAEQLARSWRPIPVQKSVQKERFYF
jgi:hypothetical protein